ncbi:PcfJ domain-containing protein [Desulfosporosinus sp. OT]|uniref:PcfJ domain-containing protein n=1 Tax=Desulfosporosinus sp. OT TaxID=913865 RepID=UPI0002239F7F|nr:PcfJ domain-containing protein [Desulfosporosinus sp. OT]EGW40678.1 hypothetical protein DOT_1301 [Desulfosporosinus sp. OT]
MLVAELVIPQMFTAYAEDISYLQNGLHHFQYFCEECDQAFCSAWGKVPGISLYERGSHFICPYCGHRHHENVVYAKREQDVPNKIRLTVREYKKVVTFEVSSETVIFTDYLHLRKGFCKEVFRFDIAKQKVTFSSIRRASIWGPVELGNPFRLEIFESILCYFTSSSLAKRSDLNNILKVLRETVQRKLEKHLKHKVSSMFISSGRYHGAFLLPIFNIAYRIACPDASNLPVEYRESPKEIQHFWELKLLSNEVNKETYSIDLMDHVISLTRRKIDFITAIIKTQSLPDRPMIRRTLREDPFNVNILSQAFNLCENYDYAIRMYEGLKELGDDGRVRWSLKDNLFQFLNEMKPLYGEVGICRLVEDYMKTQVWDCVTLFQQLNEENLKALRSESIRLRDLHDWMSLRHKKQTHMNLKFDVPEHVIKRLSMQTERLRFFMPKESMELLIAGHELNNCVASYGKAMKDNSKWIVLVADDKGKLAVCLEIKGNELVQAKTNRNKAVSLDNKLNSAVIAWAKEANLEIKTSDINVPGKEKLTKTGLVTVPA